jgi:hypothetical protein
LHSGDGTQYKHRTIENPLVVVLATARPSVDLEISEQANALVAAWGLGAQGGTAVAEVLFGDVNPGGKLPVTLARNAGQLPMFYNVKPSARRGYLFDSSEPLYPFGWGLGYSTFVMGAPRLSAAAMGIAGSVQVSVEVRNTGARPATRRSSSRPRQGELGDAPGEGAQGFPARKPRARREAHAELHAGCAQPADVGRAHAPSRRARRVRGHDGSRFRTPPIRDAHGSRKARQMTRIGRRKAIKRIAGLAAYAGAAAAIPAVAAIPGEPAPYKDPALPVDQRVRDLLSRMTLEETIGQMIALWFTKADVTEESGLFRRRRRARRIPRASARSRGPRSARGSRGRGAPPRSRGHRSPRQRHPALGDADPPRHPGAVPRGIAARLLAPAATMFPSRSRWPV